MEVKASELQRIKDVYERRIEAGAHLQYSLLKAGELYFSQVRERSLVWLLSRGGKDLADARILEVGCGRGNRLLDCQRWGAAANNLFGIDLMEPLLQLARSGLPSARLAVANAGTLPFGDETFDIVAQFYMFTSVLDAQLRERAAREIWRVLRPGGAVLWHDFRCGNPRNPHVRPVGRREISRLFPHAVIHIRSTTLAPPLARALAPHSFLACDIAALLPFLRTHYAALLEKPTMAS